ncbi:MAG: riboflavin biosynthesis protein RibF [Oscillospiraceae bacterium]|nr:riboflavin biosynthesis protein RibF [Oscillospiraceae bacterium]
MQKRVIALGFFDGVHRGHAALLGVACQRARDLGASPAVLTFDTHPATHTGGEAAPLINSLAGRLELIWRLHGIQDVIVVPFDETFRRLPWDAFVAALKHDYGAIHVVCGHNYHFGYSGTGNPQRLQAKCMELGIGADVVPEVKIDGTTVSSTHIRSLLTAGDMETAARFLGHAHTLIDTVHHGFELGRTLGAPTINMAFPSGVLIPPCGVYATQVFLPDEPTGRTAVTNIGRRPTVSETGNLTVESYILDFSGDLYNQQVRVEFHRFLRPEMKFADVEELKAQIERDAKMAAGYFDGIT